MSLPPDDPLRPRTRFGWAFSVLGLLPLGCEPPRTPRDAVVQEDATAEEDRALRAWLGRQIVLEPDLHEPRVLYTWTTAEQIAELRNGSALLTRTHGANGQRSGFDHALDREEAGYGRYLRWGASRGRRFAWPNPWATRRGWPGANYGDRLIEVELRPESWIARFDPDAPAGERWDVLDAEGRVVSAPELDAQPWRVAAIYHRGRGPGPNGSLRVYREYVLVSEVMIERFSFGTAEIVQRLARDRVELAMLEARLRATSRAGKPSMHRWTYRLLDRWWSLPSGAELFERYEAALAFGSEHYLPHPDRIAEIAASLIVPEEAELVTVPWDPTASVHCDPTMGCFRR